MNAPLSRMVANFAPVQPDRDLLARFVHDRDEAAFTALVHRHGPMVYGVCRRLLGNCADADDAFQAVFLVLANRAGALAQRPALGGWLYEVAVRVAKKARTTFERLRRHERRAAEGRMEHVFDPAPDDSAEWLDRELAALPERLREPVVQCLIRERPRAEVAAELGIPEGTLASRLDAARKRLAERLARHRVPLALGGLLASVPSSLTAATTKRVADGSGSAIHQLAQEVTKTMSLSMKRAAPAVLAVAAAVGGLLLATDRSAPPSSPPGDTLVVRRAAPVSAEPAWLATFRKRYALKDGEYVKRVAPPYVDERKEYMYRVWYPEKQTPEDEAKAREILDRDQLTLALFLNFDGARVTTRTSVSAPGLCDIPERERDGKMLSVWDTVAYVTEWEHPEIAIDPKSSDHPLLSRKDHTSVTRSVSGDFVIRKGAPIEKVVRQLERIFRDECKLDVRLTLKEEEQTVFVVGGTFKPKPPEWRPKKELDFYAAEDGLNKEYDHFGGNNKNSKARNWQTVNTSLDIGTPAALVRSVGNRLGTRMVWDGPLPTEFRVSWHQHTFRTPTKEQEALDRDPEKVLPVVTAQTGLTFRKDKRRVQVLYLSAPAPQ
ncbi:RNA polymerase sigma factor [Gemmata obscuriglobus]|nr:RNA polymerase sigma factor [Gemmata obscuriglobus]